MCKKVNFPSHHPEPNRTDMRRSRDEAVRDTNDDAQLSKLYVCGSATQPELPACLCRRRRLPSQPPAACRP